MHESLQQQLIQRITEEWQSVSKNGRPSGVWIRQYPPLAPKADGINDPAEPLAVWFLSADGLRLEAREAWQQHLVHQQESPPDVSDMRYPVGFAAFAPYEDESRCYSETQWGPRWGRGWRWRVESGRLHGRDMLWIS